MSEPFRKKYYFKGTTSEFWMCIGDTVVVKEGKLAGRWELMRVSNGRAMFHSDCKIMTVITRGECLIEPKPVGVNS